LLGELEDLPPGATLLKLGRFGGVFSKTLEDMDGIQLRKPASNRGWGKTRFLAHVGGSRERAVCTGWCKVEARETSAGV
jgi:hypothetical protein